MINQVVDKALARLEEFRSSGRLIRGGWQRMQNGRKVACLLAALSPEVGDARSANACPTELLDPWFAHLSPWFNDDGSIVAWPGMVASYGGAVRKLMSLPIERRHQLEYGARAIIVREAMRHTQHTKTLLACKTVAKLCEAVAAGQLIDEEAFRSAGAAAHAARERAWAESASWATGAMAEVLGAVTRAEAVARAGAGAAWAAAWVRAGEMATVDAAAWAAAGATEVAAAVDRITTAIFDLIQVAK